MSHWHCISRPCASQGRLIVMKMTPEVIAALAVLRQAAENDFERHRLDVLERDLTAPPTVEQIDDTHQRFNGVTFLKQNNGHYQCSLGVHVAVWHYYHGEIPVGSVIHHVDEMPSNNIVDNLQLMSKAEHGRRHPPINTAPETRQMLKRVCVYCGEEFRTFEARSKYCSKRCRQKAHRENMMVPHVCVVCGRVFKADKRFHVKCCSPRCSAILTWRKRKGVEENVASDKDK